MVKTFGLTHIALAVQDAERAFRFYNEVFGMVAVYRENGFIQAQTPGSRDVLVLEEKGMRSAGSGGIAHFGFRLVDSADIDDAVRAVEAAGGEILGRGEFCPGEPYVFCRDPDGYEIEIWHELPTPVDPVAPARRTPEPWPAPASAT
jgi:catechol 2,3-dioxygenase-like lactoylglutathione lyase family enzyme